MIEKCSINVLDYDFFGILNSTNVTFDIDLLSGTWLFQRVATAKTFKNSEFSESFEAKNMN